MDKICEVCHDIGWVREDKKVCEEGFGKLVPCECNQEGIDYLKSLEPQPEPIQEPHPAQMRWTEYTE